MSLVGPQQERFINMSMSNNQNINTLNQRAPINSQSAANFIGLQPGGNQRNGGHSQFLSTAGSSAKSFQEKRLEEENCQMRFLSQKLAQKLKEQYIELKELKVEKCIRHGQVFEDTDELVIEQQIKLSRDDPSFADKDRELVMLLSSHTLGPLIENYERTIAQLQTDLTKNQFQFKQQMQDCQNVIIENDQLRDQLEVQKREFLRLVEENRDHAGVTKPNKRGEGQPDDEQNQAGIASLDEIMELKNRAHLLTEENQVLFQQISVLRSHFDQVNKDTTAKTDDATKKINQYANLQKDLQTCMIQRDSNGQTCKFLEKRLSDLSQRLGLTEESRKKEQVEMKKLREQFNLITREYEFYKELSEKLEFRQTDELQTLNTSVRKLVEAEKDYKQKIELYERENQDCQHQNRQLISDLQRMQRDLKSIMAVNEEYQVQSMQFKERELQYNELAREYRDKLEAVKFEREKIGLKEEQFVKQIQKVETQSKQDMKRNMDKHESQMMSRQRDFKKKLNDMEERLTAAQDDADTFRRNNERLSRENVDLQRSVDNYSLKEDRTIQQYEKIMDQLKSEIKDKERQSHTIETREAYARQELSQKNKDLQLSLDEKQTECRDKHRDIKHSENLVIELREKLHQTEVQLQAFKINQFS